MCEAMVKVLIKRLHPTVQAIDGSGGDGGIDLLMHTEHGLVIYQIKPESTDSCSENQS